MVDRPEGRQWDGSSAEVDEITTKDVVSESDTQGDAQPTGTHSTASRKERGLALALSLAVVLAYNLVLFNRFFPLQEGWYSAVAHEILAGRRPYRDFYLFLQPIYPLLITLLIKLFGYGFIVLRIWGLVERLLLTGVVYLLLERVFRPRVALVAVLVTMAVYASNTTDVIYSYYQLCLVFALGSALALMNATERTARAGQVRWATLAGLLAGLAFFTKQTTGLFVPAAALLVACLVFVAEGRGRRLVGLLCAWAVGAALPAGVLLGWLVREGALGAYLKDVFTGAGASKGGLLILVSFLPRVLDARSVVSFVGLAAFAAAMVLLAPSRWRRRPQWLASLDRFDALLVVATVGVLAVSWPLARLDRWHLWLAYGVAVAGVLALRRTGWRPKGSGVHVPGNEAVLLLAIAAAGAASLALPLTDWRWFWAQYQAHGAYLDKLVVVHWTFYFAVGLTLVLVVRMVRAPANRRTTSLLFVAAAAAAVMYAHGLSYTIEEHAVAPGLGLMVGLALEADTGWRHGKTIVVCGFCVVLLVTCAAQRYAWPYEWWGWTEPPIALATTTPNLPDLAGLRLSPATNAAIDQVTGLVDQNAGRPGGVFTFPSIPLFYVLSGHYPATFALVHYWDVCPDWVARADAQRLLADPPAVIVVLDLPPSVWKFHEEAFRGGRPSGQRQIVAALEQIVTRGRYHLAMNLPTDTDGALLKVWVRPSSRAPAAPTD
jgi:hypothetical protein